MKSFFASTDKENAQQAGYLFLIVNILGFVTQGIMGMESPPGELLVNFLWGLSLSGVILTIKPLLGDNVPENWREGTTFFAAAVFFFPNFMGHPDNYIPANPMVTPAHIVPEWYFLPFYAILRAVPDKLGGVLLMFGAIVVLFILPWLDRQPIRSSQFRPLYKILFWIL